MIHGSIRHVVAVAQFGSFTAAAAQSGVSQSAVTRSIADLEKMLGYELFIRTARGASLTGDGLEFVDRAARLLEDVDRLLHGAKGRRDPYAEMLKVGVGPASLEWMMVDPLALLLERHPMMRMHVTGGVTERIIQQLRSGAIDVAFGFDAALGEQADFKCALFGPLKTVMFVRRGHPILACEKITAADLAKYPIVAPSESRPYGAFVRGIFEGQAIDAELRIHTTDFFPMVKRIVGSTDTISFVAEDFTKSASFQTRFTRVPYEWHSSPVCCAVRSKSEPRPIVRAFLRACREKLGG